MVVSCSQISTTRNKKRALIVSQFERYPVKPPLIKEAERKTNKSLMKDPWHGLLTLSLIKPLNRHSKPDFIAGDSSGQCITAVAKGVKLLN